MSRQLLAALCAVFLWWFGTGLIFYLNGLRRETFGRSMIGATAVLALALYGMWTTAPADTAAGAYIAFACAVAAWGWLELGFLTGYVIGPRRVACPASATLPRRFVLAARTLLHHEAAILAAIGAAAAITWEQPNKVALWTLLLLGGMRLSAKLNLFLGVRNSGTELLPDHLRYLGTYFGRQGGNALLPLSLAGAVAVAGLLLAEGFAAGADASQQVGFTLLGTLAALAALEHALMVVPLPNATAALWGWGLKGRS